VSRSTLGIFLRKELRELRHNPQVWPGYLLLPLIAIAFPVIFIAVIPGDVSSLDPDMASLMRLASRDPLIARYPEAERIGRLVSREWGAFILIIPMILSGMSAALAIAVEKQQRTLEPVLATPLSPQELLAAKLVAALGPAVLATWVSALLSVVGTAIVTSFKIGVTIWPEPAGILTMAIVAPLCGAASALLGMRASMRAADVHSAVQTAGLWVVPMGMVLAGLLGRPAMRSVAAGLFAIGLTLALSWWLFRGNVRRFEREEILTRWR
jgi:ABC-2 type transport system permease protein